MKLKIYDNEDLLQLHGNDPQKYALSVSRIIFGIATLVDSLITNDGLPSTSSPRKPLPQDKVNILKSKNDFFNLKI